MLWKFVILMYHLVDHQNCISLAAGETALRNNHANVGVNWTNRCDGRGPVSQVKI